MSSTLKFVQIALIAGAAWWGVSAIVVMAMTR